MEKEADVQADARGRDKINSCMVLHEAVISLTYDSQQFIQPELGVWEQLLSPVISVQSQVQGHHASRDSEVGDSDSENCCKDENTQKRVLETKIPM